MGGVIYLQTSHFLVGVMHHVFIDFEGPYLRLKNEVCLVSIHFFPRGARGSPPSLALVSAEVPIRVFIASPLIPSATGEGTMDSCPSI